MMPHRPAPSATPSVQRTLGYEEPTGAKRTLAYDGTPAHNPNATRSAMGAFDATIVEHATPHAPPLPTEVPAVSGFETTMLGGNSPLPRHMAETRGASDLLPASAQLGAPASGAPGTAPLSGGSVPPRSTVLPRVELMDGQPRISVQDRPRYQETRRLGEGGVGEVVMVRDNDIERHVALKRLRPELLGTTALARFVEEIRVVGQLEHPSIVPIHDVGLDEKGQFFFVMKYVNGETLENIIEKLAAGDPAYHARFPFERRVELFITILEAMAYAHDKGYVHRDIKPANIMIGPYGEVMVMDWGLAKKVGSAADYALATPEREDGPGNSKRLQETRVGSLLGTPLYMSPEQARGQHDTLDQRSDIYSLCMLLFELLATRHPLHHCTDLNQVLHSVTNEASPTPMDKIWELSPIQGPVPADLRHIVVKGLQKSPDQRYHSVQQLIQRIHLRAQGCIDIECPITFWMSLTGKARRTIERHPVLSASVLSLVALTSTANMIYSVVSMIRT
jgi:serine/threonine protein kinase